MFDFGPLASQYDPDILKYFHTTKQIKRVVTRIKFPSNFIFVARPGAGKTTLVKWLEGGNHDRRVITIRADEIRLIIDDDVSPTPEDYRLLISAELFTGVISEIKNWEILSIDLQNECEDYLRNIWWKSVEGFFKGKFEGISIMGYGFSLKASDRRAYLRQIRKGQNVQKASELLKKIGNEIDVIVVIDDPEFIVGQGLEDVTFENAIRIGSFLSVLNMLHSLGIQVIVFVKEHILQSIQENYRDFSHYEDRIEGLEWTADDLIELIKLRLSNRLRKSWEIVFTINKSSFSNLIFPRLINGPRDLLYICNTAGKTDDKISKISLQKSIDALKRRKWGDITTQFNSQWPKIDIFAKRVTTLILDELGDKPISRKKFIESIEKEFSTPTKPLHDLRKQETWINTALWASPSIEERLFVVGCLGYIYQGDKYYPWNGRSIEKFRLADKVFISPLFAS